MERYGLIGYPLGHSFSARYFNERFEREKREAEYVNYEIPSIEDFREVMKDESIRGLNVTIPYKEKIIPYLDGLDEAAAEIGAVNVIRILRHDDGRKELKGYNSDVIGFMNSIAPLLKPHHTHALILGTGGASKAVHHGLLQLGISVLNVSRTPKNSGTISYADVNREILEQYKIIVNTTPLGMFPKTEEAPDLPYSLTDKDFLLYDLVYNPEITTFMRKGAERGAVVKNGLEMLHLQAEAAWNIWNK